MATVSGLTKDRMLLIEGNSIVSGTVVGDNLILTKKNGATVNAGNVRGPQGVAVSGSGGTVDGAYFGIGASNGADDDSAKWADAFNAIPNGGTLVLPAGKDSRVTTGVSRTYPIVVKGQGGKIIFDGSGTMFNLSGNYDTPIAITAIANVPITEVGAANGVTSVLTLASAPGWRPGDYVKVVGDEVIPQARPGSGTGAAAVASRIGEFAIVRAVSGTTVTLGGVLRETYTTNPRVVLIPKESSELQDISLYSPNFETSAFSNSLVIFSRQVNPVVNNLVVRGAPATVLMMKSCMGYTVRRFHTMFARNNPNGGQYGYGLNDNSSSFGVVEGMMFGYGRHAFTDDTARITAANSDLTNYGRSFSANVQGHAIGTSAQAWDSHAAGEGHKYRVSASNISTGYAVQLRGRNHEVEVTADNCRGALAVFEESEGGFTYGIMARKVIARNCSESAIKVNLAPTGHPTGAGTRRTDNVALRVGGTVVITGTPRFVDVSNAVVDISDIRGEAVPIQPVDYPELILNTNSELRGNNNLLDITRNTSGSPTPVRTATGSPSPAIYDLDGFRIKATTDSASRVVDIFSGPNSIQLRLRRGQFSHRFTGAVLGSYDIASSSVEYKFDNSDVSSAYLFKTNTDFAGGTGFSEIQAIADTTIYANINTGGQDFNIGVMPVSRIRGQRLLISLTQATGSVTFSNGIGNRLFLLQGNTTVAGLGAQIEFIWDGVYWREVGNLRQAPVPLFGLLNTGQETIPRWAVNGYTPMTSGLVRFAQFTAREDSVVNNIRIVGGTTAAGATPTLIKFGLYSVSATGAYTRMADTASDTTVFGTASVAYTKALTSPQTLVSGQRYAIAALVVTTATAPTVAVNAPTLPNMEMGLGPVSGQILSGQTDLAASYAAGVPTTASTTFYAVVV